MGASGADVLLSEAALSMYPFAIEVKCQESLNIWAALEQAKEHVVGRLTGYKSDKIRPLTPLLCFKRNRSEMYVALRLEDFLELKTKA